MPCDYAKYPPNWKTEIRPRILARAGELRDARGNVIEEAVCEYCGVLNHSHVLRDGGAWEYCFPETEGETRIILTVAHLDHDIENNADENLAALCQKCHLTHDAKQHADTARRTRETRSGQALLFQDAT